MDIHKAWTKGKMYSLRCVQCCRSLFSRFDIAPICDIYLIKKAKSLDSAVHNYEVYSKCDDKYAIYANELFRPYYYLHARYVTDNDKKKIHVEPCISSNSINVLGVHLVFISKKTAANTRVSTL